MKFKLFPTQMWGTREKNLVAIRKRMTNCVIGKFTIITLSFVSCCCLAQTNELESDLRLKVSIDAVRKKLLNEENSTSIVIGEKSFQALIGRLTNLDNLDQLCDQGLGSERLCRIRSAEVDPKLLGTMGNPQYQSLDLVQFRKGMGRAISNALSKPENLSQSKTKASLIIPDLQAYTEQVGVQKPSIRVYLRSFLNMLPAMAMADQFRFFKTSDQAAMVGELIADVVDTLIEKVATPLDRCSTEDPKAIGSIKMSECVAQVLSSKEVNKQLQGVGLMLQLPDQWIQEGLMPPTEKNGFFRELAFWGKLIQISEIVSIVDDESGQTLMGFRTSFRVEGQACTSRNKYCRELMRYNDVVHCTLESKPLASKLCWELTNNLQEAFNVLNRTENWSYVHDIVRVLAGKKSKLPDVQQYVDMVNIASDSFKQIAQKPQSELVWKFRQITQKGLLFDSHVWIVDAITLRQSSRPSR